jgi:hypothetical protein
MRNPYAYAAAVWAILFAVPSFYWTLGGDFGTGTIAADIEESLGAASKGWVIGLTGVGKVLLGLFAASFVALDAGWLRSLRIAGGVILAIGLVLYGIVNLIGHVLQLAGVSEISASLGRTAVCWHTFFWDPYWILGGVLFGVAVLRFRNDERAHDTP